MKKVLLAALLLAACLPSPAQNTTYPDPDPKYGVFYGQRASLFNQLPIYTGDIVMLGNSLTNGCEWHELFGMPNIKNRGITGDIVDGVADRIQPILDGKPAKIFLMIGVNDISHHLSAEEVAAMYGNLIDVIREKTPDTKLYVQSCLPINIIFDKYKVMIGKDQVIRDLNTLVKNMESDKGFTWIDLYTEMSDSDGHLKVEYTNDGLHLLGPGYLKWREVLLPYILE